MKIEQYVMAYGVEQDRLRALLPGGFLSIRPVLRINAEIRDCETAYLEFNTAVETDGKRGWLNIGSWTGIPFERTGKTVIFKPDFLTISFTAVGVEGSCPAEKDNAGCFFPGQPVRLRPAEQICVNKEFCDCEFAWHFSEADACGVSIGKTLPAFPTEPKIVYPKEAFTVQNAASIPCIQVLGAYLVKYDRMVDIK